jgi:hypothetical protein
MQKQVFTQQQRRDAFDNNQHIQFLFAKMTACSDAYEANSTDANLETFKTALGVYNLAVKELNDRLDAGYTY